MIDVDSVTVSLGGYEALTDVTLSVRRGRFLGLVGPNGAGKTTLIRTLNGRLQPDGGSVRIAGREIAALPSAASSRLVATVPQETSLAFEFPVRDVVSMGRTAHRSRLAPASATDREAVERAMQRTQVATFAERSVGTLSGGERQRVLLARALAQQAPVLLLDEPTASLDIGHEARLLDLVCDLVDDGRTVVAAVHDLDLAARYCDAIALLSGGRLAAVGPPEDVLTAARVGRAFETDVAVEAHAVTGTPSVTAHPEDS